MPMTPDEVVVILKEFNKAPADKALLTGNEWVDWRDKMQEALTLTITLIQDYQKLRERVDVDFLRKVSDKGKEMLAICEKENFVFNNLKDRWQKLAFTFYSEIAQLSSEAQAIVTYLQQPTEPIAR